MKRSPRTDSARGFTLVELMVVIVIIATLATIVGINLAGTTDDADVTAARAQITNLKTALLAYKVKNKRFPETSEGLKVLVDAKILDATEVPKDPWGNDYVYRSESSSEYEVISYGADGQPGGSGIDADISSTNLAGTSS